jgi:hypothetical protein
VLALNERFTWEIRVKAKQQRLYEMYRDPEAPRVYTRQSRPTLARRPNCPERVLITCPSPMSWATSCMTAGANCRALAHETLVDRMVGFDQLEARGQRCDVIGFFNTLDHFPDPWVPLARAVKLADYVVVEIHAHGWTDPQHLYNVGDGFLDLLRGRGLNALEVGDLLGIVAEDDSPLRRRWLISRNHPLDQSIISVA